MILPGTLLKPVYPRIVMRRKPFKFTTDAMESTPQDVDSLAVCLSGAKSDGLIMVLYLDGVWWVRHASFEEVLQ